VTYRSHAHTDRPSYHDRPSHQRAVNPHRVRATKALKFLLYVSSCIVYTSCIVYIFRDVNKVAHISIFDIIRPNNDSSIVTYTLTESRALLIFAID
jgi:hypothetical protein